MFLINHTACIRIALLAVLLVYLSAHSYVALIGWVDSPIGTKDALIYEEIKFFPAVTICPIPDPEFEEVITFNSNSTFEQAIEKAIRPVVYEKYYMTFKSVSEV